MKKFLTVLIALFPLALAPAARCALPQPVFTLDQLIINHQDVTPFNPADDVEAPTPNAPIPIELHFHLTPSSKSEIGNRKSEIPPLSITSQTISEGWTATSTFHWNANCLYDPSTGAGIFKITTFRAPYHTTSHFTVNLREISHPPGPTRAFPSSNRQSAIGLRRAQSSRNRQSSAPGTPAYTFSLATYPALGGVSMDCFPFYTINDLPRSSFLEYHPPTFQRESRGVPPTTSLYFTFRIPPQFQLPAAAVTNSLRIILVKLNRQDARDPFRPVHNQSDLPTGDSLLLYDGAHGGPQNSFDVKPTSSRDEFAIWIRHPDPAGPPYQNLPYLTPGSAYSLQFELATPPYLGKRYEATRFTVRPNPPGASLAVTADYQSSSFVDWHGDWFNGHLLGSDDTPAPFWGGDYLLQKQMRDKYPSLWRMIDNYYLTAQFSNMFDEFSNLFRDRSMRAVTSAQRTSPTELVVTLAHFMGARYFHDPDNDGDTLDSHPVVANDDQQIFKPGDEVLIQADHDQLIQATVKEIRPESDQLVLQTSAPLWPIHPEGAANNYPAILGPPGSYPTTIPLAASFNGTYLRLANGRPFVNWATLNYKYDFYVHTMQSRVSIENYGIHDFTGDAVTGHPSPAGWQTVSDCSYFVVRHLLTRYHANLDTFNFPIYGEGTGWQKGGNGYVALYDYYADGILRAYEKVLGVHGDDYKKVQIGMGGVMFSWGQEYLIRNLLAHCVPAPLESVFPPPPDTPSQRFAGDLPAHLADSNPLYYFTPQERDNFYQQNWQFNACFLDPAGKPLVGPGDWDSQGRLSPAAIERLTSSSGTSGGTSGGWHHSKWLLTNTRFGKGTPFRQVSAEGYGYPAEDLAKCVLFEKALLTQIDSNLRSASSEPYVQTYIQGVSTGIKQNALYSWGVSGSVPIGRPFQGTGYWPSYFADLMRRILAQTARHPAGIYDHGTFTYDTFICPDNANSGINSDTNTFATGAPSAVKWVDLGPGRRLQVESNSVTIAKDVRHLVQMVGMMSHRLAPLPDTTIAGHVISGIISKYDDHPEPPEAPESPLLLAGSATRLPSALRLGLEESSSKSSDGSPVLAPPTAAAISAAAAVDNPRRFCILLYDHNPSDLESQDTATIPLTLHLQNLPASAQSARVTVHRVDRDHGSIFTVTQSADWIQRHAGHSAFNPDTYSPTEIALLQQKSQFPLDESFPNNGAAFPLHAGTLDLNLTLGTNRVLMIEVEW